MNLRWFSRYFNDETSFGMTKIPLKSVHSMKKENKYGREFKKKDRSNFIDIAIVANRSK